MAISTLKLTPTIFILIIIIFSSNIFTITTSQQFSRTLSKSEMNLKKQKLTHLHFYLHDTFSSPNTTAAVIATAPITNTSSTVFGTLVMADDPLTVGPELTTKVVGRAQGVYGAADLNNLAFFMAWNFYFTEGQFNGSTLSILGRNAIFDAVRELPVVGGSGLFRFANGYAEARTHSVGSNTTDVRDAVVEYNVYVFHY